MDLIVDLDHWCQSATSQTSHPLKIEATVFCRFSWRDIKCSLHLFAENLSSSYVACGSHADFNGVSSRWVKSELGIKRGHSEDLIFRDFQKTGNMVDGLLRNISKLLLSPLEDRDQISFLAFECRKYLVIICMSHGRHSFRLQKGLFFPFFLYSSPPFCARKMQSVSSASPLTKSSANAIQVGAPQQPQSICRSF